MVPAKEKRCQRKKVSKKKKGVRDNFRKRCPKKVSGTISDARLRNALID